MGTANSNDETGRSFIGVSATQKQARRELGRVCVVAADLGTFIRNPKPQASAATAHASWASSHDRHVVDQRAIDAAPQRLLTFLVFVSSHRKKWQRKGVEDRRPQAADEGGAMGTLSRRQLLGATAASAAGLIMQPAWRTLATAPEPQKITPELLAAAKKEGRVAFYTSVELPVAEKVAKA